MTDIFDPSVAYCIEGDGNLAVGERLVGLADETRHDLTALLTQLPADDQYLEHTEAVCYHHAEAGTDD